MYKSFNLGTVSFNLMLHFQKVNAKIEYMNF